MTPQNSLDIALLMAYRGQPITVLVKQDTDPFNAIVQLGNQSVQVRNASTHQCEHDVARMLRFYPTSCSVNGKPTWTERFPDVANVMRTTWDGKQASNINMTPHSKGALDGFNAYIGGVLCNMGAGLPNVAPKEMFTRQNADAKNWSPVNRLTFTPITVITPDEVKELTKSGKNFAAALTDKFRIDAKVRQRSRQQMEKTIESMNLENVVTTQIWLLATPRSVHYRHNDFNHIMPVACDGEPVLFNNPKDPSNLALLVNLLQHDDANLVPVIGHYPNGEPGEAAKRSIRWSDDLQKPIPNIVVTDAESENSRELSAVFTASGHYPHNQRVAAQPDSGIDHDQAADYAAQCFINQAAHHMSHLSPIEIIEASKLFYQSMRNIAAPPSMLHQENPFF